jgi:putative phosphoribosyl transferase
VAAEVAGHLHAPLDVVVVRKLGLPAQPELAMGAIASGGVRLLNRDVLALVHVPDSQLDAVTAVETRELERRERLYRSGRVAHPLRDRVVILVDDGLATGATMEAAVQAVRLQQPARIVVAVPVGSPDAVARLRHSADEVVCVDAPASFTAVGEWYEDFAQTSDEEVQAALRDAQGS